MKEDPNKIIENLSILYELALASGSSMDSIENCTSFMKVMMSRKNLSSSAFLLPQNKSKKLTYVSLKCIPLKFINDEVVFNNSLFKDLEKFGGLIINESDKRYKQFVSLINNPSGHFMIFLLENKSVLILNRMSHQFEMIEKLQLQKVVTKFSLFMEGLFLRESYHQEIEHRKAIEKDILERQLIFESLIQNSFNGIDIIVVPDKNEVERGERLVIRNDQMSYLLNNTSDPLPLPINLLEISAEKQANGLLSKEMIKEYMSELEKEKHCSYEWQIEHPTGVKIDLNIIDQLLSVNNKKIYIRIYQNITERKKNDDIIAGQINTLSIKNEELQKYINSNLQLENFAYIASHDLKAPLRTVSSFSDLLQESSKGKLTDKENRFLSIISQSSDQMLKLVDDLLLYSKVNDQKIRIREINIRSLLNNIISEIHSEIEVANASIVLKDIDKIIVADETKLRQLFQNLIINALKFQDKIEKPEIKISFSQNKQEWIFSVSDNGIGIRKAYSEKIFSMFSKLHSFEEYEGTGIGLAICKNIVLQHNGKIWVDSSPGHGSVFSFSISKSLNFKSQSK